MRKELLADPKERAEHVMLVDLARNDLGRVCDFGTVLVKDLMIIERLQPRDAHRVAQVEGRLSEEKTPYDLMRATFPAGTLSGAPKVRAMQIISELEQTDARAVRRLCRVLSPSTVISIVAFTIRTALIKDGKAYMPGRRRLGKRFHAGAEYQETVNKSKAMLKAVALAENFRSAG
jgi:anthranilate synthase component 1